MPPQPPSQPSGHLGGVLRDVRPAEGVELRAAMARVKGRLLRARAARRPAELALGRYTVGEELGRGGLGVVFRAHDHDLRRDVAIKILQRGPYAIAREPDRPDPLLEEARALASLSHPNVVSVFDCGVARLTSEHEEIFVVMELVEGLSLSHWLSHPRSPDAIVSAFIAAGEGLAAAHRHGLVHRDFKPDNVLVETGSWPRADAVKVTDFGLARRLDVSTSVEGAAGTPAYMAPEQREHGRARPASDQFAFCLSLLHALDAEVPPWLPPDSHPRSFGRRRRIPRRLLAALHRGLTLDPHARHPSMEALLHEITEASTRRRARMQVAVATLSAAAALAVGVAAWSGSPPANACARAPSRCEATPSGGPAGDGRPAVAQAQAQLRAGDEVAAQGELERAFFGARVARDDGAAFDAAASLTYMAGFLGADEAEASRWLAAAESVLRTPTERARLAHLQATVAQQQGRHEEAIAGFEAALTQYDAISEVRPVLRVNSLVGLGTSLAQRGDTERGFDTMRAAVELCEATYGVDGDPCGTALMNLANIEHHRGRTEQAIALGQRALGIRLRTGADHPRVADAETSIGIMWFELADYAQAEGCHRRALAIYEEKLGAADLTTATARYNLGLVLSQTDRLQEARRHYEETLSAFEAKLGPDDPRVIAVVGSLGGLLGDLEQHDEAVVYLERALRVHERPPTRPRTRAVTRFNLATALVAAGRDHDRALTLARGALADLREADAPARFVTPVRRWLAKHDRRRRGS